MKMSSSIQTRLCRDLLVSLLIYALPPWMMFAFYWWRRELPWLHPAVLTQSGIFWRGYSLVNGDKFILFVLLLGLAEYTAGRYGEHWKGNETVLDLVCFVLPKLVLLPFFTWFSLHALPVLLPRMHHAFAWVPFGWGLLMLAVADDLSQYWYHRLHHEVPWLWRFHRTHHTAPYMGVTLTRRQNVFYGLFFSPLYLTSALVYLGLGPAALAIHGIKTLITTLAHSSLPWDKFLYERKALHPIAWILERVISTPATHHAHHADTSDDGIGYYKGNFGNMFFLWDVLFSTAHISRKYPKSYGVVHYEGDPWYVQLFWPVFKSRIAESELSVDGPILRTDTSVRANAVNAVAGID
jgi:sterol desaturase/sphingolipid hydroxylase (fatty acid hydroxylase superfamily)